MTILGIETSCDETAISLVKFADTRVKILKHLVTSQIPIHQKYGGVVPEVAARSHVPETVSLITQALGRRGMNAFDVIAVTRGPGLATALRVGVETARLLAMLSQKPIMGVNHLEGHLASAWLDAKNRRQWKFPLLALVVSGGHTELVLMKDFCCYEIIGETRDDAAGECFDKSAKLMGLPYPGGPQIARLATTGDPKSFDFPRPMMGDPSFDFSFSGLKTAVRMGWECHQTLQVTSDKLYDFAASVQQAIVDVLVEKTVRAAKTEHVQGVLLVGGVSANQLLRETLASRMASEFTNVAFFPSDRKYVTDNAAMIAAAGYWRWRKGERHRWQEMDADPELSLTDF